MMRTPRFQLSFRQRLIAGLAGTVTLAMMVVLGALFALRATIESQGRPERVIARQEPAEPHRSSSVETPVQPVMRALSQRQRAGVQESLPTGADPGQPPRVKATTAGPLATDGAVVLIMGVTAVTLILVGFIGYLVLRPLQRTYLDVAAAVQARDEFLAIASHELKTPLTSLQLQVDAVLNRARQFDDDQRPSEWLVTKLHSIDRQTNRLSRLINDLLEVARVTSGRLVLASREVDLAMLVADAVNSFRDDATRADCTLIIDLTSPLRANVDPVRVEQVLANLIANAIKFGAGQPVEVSAREEGHEAVVEVRDGGIGIAEKDQARIFQRFEQAVAHEHYGGTSPSPLISRQTLAAMAGSIAVKSHPGAGSTFTVRLPLKRDSTATDLVRGRR